MITADQFLENLKARNTLPENNALLSDSKLLRFAYNLMNVHIIPKIISVREDYYVVSKDVSIVVDQQLYEMPADCIANTLRELKYRRSPTDVVDLSYIPREDEHYYRSYVGEPVGFMFQGDLLYLVGKPQNANHTLELWYEKRPSLPTLLENCAIVASVATDDVTIDSVPDTITTGTVVDFIRNKGMGRILAEQKTVTNVASLVLSFGTDVVPATAPSALAADDYIAPTGTTPIIQLPEEFVNYLETLTSKRSMGAIGDFEAKRDLSFDEKQELEDLLKLISPRIRGEPKKVTAKALLGGRSRRRGGGYYG